MEHLDPLPHRVTATAIWWRICHRWHVAGVAIAVGGLLAAPALHAQRPQRIVGAVAYAMQGRAPTPLYAEIIPVVEFARGRFRSLREEARNDRGGAPAAVRRSILNQATDFTIYQEGRMVGTVHVTRVAATLYGCAELITGIARGRAAATLGSGFGFATSPRLATQDFHRGRTLTPTAKAAIEAAIRTEFRRVPARRPGRRAPEAIGDPKVTSAWVLDVNRDGAFEVAAEAVIPLRKPAKLSDGYYDFALLLVIRVPIAGDASVLLSLPAGPLHAAERPYRFRAALDLTGDGIAELFIARTAYEAETPLVFELRSNVYVLVGEGPYIGC